MVKEDVPLSRAVPPDVHRIGGGSVENLRLKPIETKLIPPGISVLKAPTPGESATQMRNAFPGARALHKLAETVGSTTEDLIRSAGFNLIPDPTRKFPNPCRVMHPDGAPGFDDKNLERLSSVFTDSTGN